MQRQTHNQPKKGLFSGIGTMLGSAVKRVLGLDDHGPKNSARDADRSVDDVALKRKLGKAWFTRTRRGPTRRRVLMNLTSDERARMRELGWL
jgi:hypothetical protein